MSTARIILTGALLGITLLSVAPAAVAQGQAAQSVPVQARSIEPQEFVRLAYSSATLQWQAAKLAASRETRPEVRSFAATASDFRIGLLRRIEAFAKERGIPLPATKDFEHQVIIENLEPLDYIALSRRFAEIQIQALEQEIGVYQMASRAANPDIKEFAGEFLPKLERQRDEAREMYEAVRP